MGDMFSGGAGSSAGSAGGNTLGQIGTALGNASNPTDAQAQQFDPNYGIVQQQPTFGEFLQALLQSIGQR